MLRRKIFPVLREAAEKGWLLLLCTALALFLANSEQHDEYSSLINFELFHVKMSAMINDLLMAIFFLAVGIEVKYEFISGHLADRSKRLAPFVAAISGVLLPAGIYFIINYGSTDKLKGWAIPTATDIAFTIGVISILGKYISSGLRALVTTIAVIDDIIAIIIITLFYNSSLDAFFILLAIGCILCLVLLNTRNVQLTWAYLSIGAVMWIFTLYSGIHATIAGVILGILIPQNEHMEKRILKVIVPLCSYLILPLFAFFNSGIRISDVGGGIFTGSVFAGITAGLFLGKQAGIFLSLFGLSKAKVISLPTGTGTIKLYIVSILCGIGFTMSLFITLLAFPYGSFSTMNEAKIGVISGSFLSMALGLAIAFTHMLIKHIRKVYKR